MVDEKKKNSQGIIRKCKCDSVWCSQCFVYRYAPKQMEKLKVFDWTRTRMIMLSVDPALFANTQDAYFAAKKKKSISQFIARLKRGQKIKVGKDWVWQNMPVNITRYMSFLEWHRDGRPHWYLFVETAKGGMIGSARIREYWDLGKWIHEDPIKSQAHWDHMTGYFAKNGYFHKGKKHQSVLPAWAMDVEGLKIRRWSSSVFLKDIIEEKKRQDQVEMLGKWFEKQTKMIIDTKTGEVIKDKTIKEKGTTYRIRLKACGQKTWMRLSSPDVVIQGVVDIPYLEVRKGISGKYVEGKGFAIELNQSEFDYFFYHIENVEWFEGPADISNIKRNMENWHEHRASQGYHAYSAIYS